MPKKAQIFHFSSFWKRQEKYDKLNDSRLDDVKWEELELKEPYYFFVPKDFEAEEKYNEGFSVSEIFIKNSMWIATWKDSDFVSYEKSLLIEKFWEKNVTKYNYRLFDQKYVIYDNDIIQRARVKIMNNLYLSENISLITTKYLSSSSFKHVFLSKNIFDRCVLSNKWKEWNYSFPLYLYQENKLENKEEKVPNFNMEIIEKIEEKLNLKLNSDFSPENLFDYIYAVLHSKTYRETYKEFLKIDFPKVPFDTDKETFFKMVELWKELRSFHLMENENLVPKNFITTYQVDWDNEVGKIKFEVDKTPGASSKNKLLAPGVEEKDINWKVFINDTQYFDWIPKEVFEFYIWGYQPAQKWLKDRKWRKLNYEDILHYSKIILCLKETIDIMWEIEKIFNDKKSH